MSLQQQGHSLELSKRLKELGVKQGSVFWWSQPPSGEEREVIYYEDKQQLEEGFIANRYDLISAFTVADLDDLLLIGTSVVKTSSDYTVHEPTTVEHKRWGTKVMRMTQTPGL